MKTREEYENRDDFYKDVAEMYKEQLRTRKPTQQIALAYGVPHSTAARWVRVARRLGHLPPFTF